MSVVTRRLLIEGRVQGVGFRWSLHSEALRHGLRGWVRNRRDGSVEALLCGEEDAVDMLIAWSRQGPPSARVDRVICTDVLETEDIGVTERFTQKPTLLNVIMSAVSPKVTAGYPIGSSSVDFLHETEETHCHDANPHR